MMILGLAGKLVGVSPRSDRTDKAGSYPPSGALPGTAGMMRGPSQNGFDPMREVPAVIAVASPRITGRAVSLWSIEKAWTDVEAALPFGYGLQVRAGYHAGEARPAVVIDQEAYWAVATKELEAFGDHDYVGSGATVEAALRSLLDQLPR